MWGFNKGFNPRGPLTVVDFAQVEDLSLKPPPLRAATIFADAPVAMLFAILEPWMALEEQRWLTHVWRSLSKSGQPGRHGVWYPSTFGPSKENKPHDFQRNSQFLVLEKSENS